MRDFVCAAVVRDSQNNCTITVEYDPERSDWLFGASVVVEDDRGSREVTVRDIRLVGDYIRVYYMDGREFAALRLAIFIPTQGQGDPIIGGWQTALEESGLKPRSMNEMDRLSQEGIYATQPFGYADSPDGLIEPREIELVSIIFNAGD